MAIGHLNFSDIFTIMIGFVAMVLLIFFIVNTVYWNKIYEGTKEVPPVVSNVSENVALSLLWMNIFGIIGSGAVMFGIVGWDLFIRYSHSHGLGDVSIHHHPSPHHPSPHHPSPHHPSLNSVHSAVSSGKIAHPDAVAHAIAKDPHAVSNGKVSAASAINAVAAGHVSPEAAAHAMAHPAAIHAAHDPHYMSALENCRKFKPPVC